MPNLEEFASKLIALYGGPEKFYAETEKRLVAFNAIWNQDAERIVRVLRAHLAVEHFLGSFLAAHNPQLPSLRSARLTFSQKIELLPDNAPSISFLKPGLRKLNTVRNRMAHRLQVEIDEDDREAFLAITLFKAMRAAGESTQLPKANDPLSVLEDFSRFAATLLDGGADPSKELWIEAADQTHHD